MTIKNLAPFFACFVLLSTLPSAAQQKGQWVPGQFGLNAGVIPDPGITYANLAMNYSASELNDSNGNHILHNVTELMRSGSRTFFLRSKHKILGGYSCPTFL
jgi:hypothetical protein